MLDPTLKSRVRWYWPGWSRGAKAAAAASLSGVLADGWLPDATVCLAAGFSSVEPATGFAPIDLAARSGHRRFHLVHGTQDTIVSLEQSRSFADALIAPPTREVVRPMPQDAVQPQRPATPGLPDEDPTDYAESAR